MTANIRLKHLRRFGGALALLGVTLTSVQLTAAAPMHVQSPPSLSQALALARSLAGSAARTETRALTPDRITVRRLVQPALQSVIISAGEPPVQVQMALQDVLKTCHTTNGPGITIDDMSCPGRQGSYDALQDLLRTVTALIDQEAQPAGGDASHGSAAFASVPGGIAAGGGPDYRQPN